MTWTAVVEAAPAAPRNTVDDPLLKTTEVAVLLSLSPETVRYWRHVKRGPRWFRVGSRAVRYRRSEVLRWLADVEKPQDEQPSDRKSLAVIDVHRKVRERDGDRCRLCGTTVVFTGRASQYVPNGGRLIDYPGAGLIVACAACKRATDSGKSAPALLPVQS